MKATEQSAYDETQKTYLKTFPRAEESLASIPLNVTNPAVAVDALLQLW